MSARDVRTYRGTGVEELIPQIRAELGDDAVIVDRREVLTGGVGGFFQKRLVELHARRGGAFEVTDDGWAGPGDDPAYEDRFDDEDGPDDERDGPDDERDGPSFADQLARLTQDDPPPAAPARRPVVDPAVTDGPASAFPPADELARMFRQGLDEPEDEVAAEELGAEEPDAEELDAVVLEQSEPTATDEPADRPDLLDASASEGHTTVQQPPADAPAVEAPHAVAAAPAVEAPPFVEEPPAPAEAVAVRATTDLAVSPQVAALTRHGLSERFARAVVDQAVTHVAPLAATRDPLELLAATLAARIEVLAPRQGAGAGTIAFAGPGGSGKTRCVARLAAAYAGRSPLAVTVIALRAEDGGAELSRLLEASGIEVHAEDDAQDAVERARAAGPESLVVVDTPGVSPRAEASLRALAADLAVLAPIECHLTVSAATGPAAARELLEGGRVLGVDAIAVTHLDETDQLGTVVELAVEQGLPLSYLAQGTAVDAGLRPAVAEEIARALLT